MIQNTIENECFFLSSVTSIKALPNENLNEIGFWGRSNVGKSSLLNSIVTNPIARTSKNPGRTTSLNFFEVPKRVRFVDFPGYGYAKKSKIEVYEWNKLILDYLKIRKNLFAIFLLIDSRHCLKKNDILALELLELFKKNFFIVLTKIDKVKKNDLDSCCKNIYHVIKNNKFAKKSVFFTSSKKNEGIKELRKVILAIK